MYLHETQLEGKEEEINQPYSDSQGKKNICMQICKLPERPLVVMYSITLGDCQAKSAEETAALVKL